MAKINFKVPPASADRAPIDIARSYIAAGIAVFPCREQASEGVDYATGELITFSEKAPWTTYGLKDATTSRRIIDIWFGDRHPNAVIGIPTGDKLGGWVLDLDRHGDRDGHTWLAEMEAVHGPLPDTARARTANGGTHVFFKHVDGVRNRAAIAPGVDTRGEAGYIVGPGSIMADGRRYEWIDHDSQDMPEFADAPAWLLDLVLPKTAALAPTQPREYTYQPEASTGAVRYASRAMEMELDKLSSSPKGQRGQQLFASACSIGELVAGGHISRDDAESGLIDAARANGLVGTDGERKCMDKIKRGLDKTANSPRHIPDREYDNDNTPSIDTERMVANKLAKAAAVMDAVSEPVPQNAQAATSEPTVPRKKERFELTWFDEIEEGKPKETILKGWLGEGEFTTISGLPGTGKSVVTTDLACHIAHGKDWHGIKVKQGLVIYVAAERKKLTERRMMAFRKHHDAHNVPLLVVGGRMDFTKDLKDANDLIAAIREAETVTGMRCVWVIIDTLTRVFGAGDQNASKDMTRFVQSCDHILAETKAHVTAIHHSAWSGERGKGAIDLDGAVDASFMVKKEGNKHRLVCDGTNDGEEGDVLAFTMQSVAIGQDEDGEPTTAPVVVPADIMDSGERLVANIKGHNARALEVLRELLASSGGTVDSPHFPSDAVVVREDAWRQAFYDDDKESTKQATLTQRFSRAYKFFKEAGQIEHIGQWVFIK